MKAGQHLAIGTHRAYLPCFTSPSALSLLAGVTPAREGDRWSGPHFHEHNS